MTMKIFGAASNVCCCCLMSVLLLSSLAAAAAATATDKLPRGVAPQDASLYSGKSLTCDGGKTTIPIARVNDDFCDCQDGLDEPGTSACAKGKFFCPNKLHTGQFVPSSRVNDGICDCCDGHDEWAKTVNCPNTCKELGAVTRQKAREQLEAAKKGIEAKEAMIRKASGGLKQVKTDLQINKDKLAEQEKVVEQLKAKLREVQDAEDKKAAELKALEPPAPPHEEEKPIPPPPPEYDENGYPISLPEHQDAPTDPVDDTKEDKPKEEPPVHPDLAPFKEATRVAQKAVDDAEGVKRDIQNKVNDLQRDSERDFGPDNCYFSLKDECFSVKADQYNYEICPFRRSEQKNVDGGGSTHLGNWDKWDKDYSEMFFNNGLRCWNGPDRTMRVSISCGAENKALDASEPGRCEYAMKFVSPCACTKEDLLKREAQVRQYDEEEKTYHSEL